MRLVWVAIFSLIALVCLTAAFLVPSHLRAIDAHVVERAGTGTLQLVDDGLNQLKLEKVGAARMLFLTAVKEQRPDRDRLENAIRNFATAHPELAVWGAADPYLPRLIKASAPSNVVDGIPVLEIFLRRENRDALFQFLSQSRRPGVQLILANRALTNTTLFPAVTSASGQPLDAVILVTAMLAQGDHLTASLREAIETAAAQANQGDGVRAMELIYLDMLALAKRLNWGQLIEFMRPIEKTTTLHDLASLARIEHLPSLFAAVHGSESPERLTQYLKHFGKSGMVDVRFGLRAGRGGLRELLDRQQRIFYPAQRQRIASQPPFHLAFASFLNVSHYAPVLGVVFKYAFVFLGGFFLARAAGYAWPEPSPLERSLRLPAFSTLRQLVFASLLLICTIVFFEPFLAQESQSRDFPFRWHFPAALQAIRTTITNSLTPIMDQLTILSLALFFLIQAVIYVLCLLKIAEIRRQPVASSVKLRLLENEENLFDAGLYVGLGGTVASLVILVFGIIKPSLMAAYSSTLFGILFVAVLKICHLRPYRRQLILETEALRS